jgi:mono/diheme cytochrome c family protein
MKFLAGIIVAIVVLALAASAIIIGGVFDVAATTPPIAIERSVLSHAMYYSVLSHAGPEVQKSWSDDQMRQGFSDYNEMCTACHGAPGRERSEISRGLNPTPPDLSESTPRWSNAQLFWIVKNGIKMTGMPGFGPTHSDDAIWNIIGFVRRLHGLSPEQYEQLEKASTSGPEHHHDQDHHH